MITVHTSNDNVFRNISINNKNSDYTARIIDKNVWGVFYKNEQIASTNKVRQVEFFVAKHLAGGI